MPKESEKNQMPVPLEGVEQKRLFEWACYESGKYPELRMMFHIPNEGKRNPRTGARMKTEGMKSGVPDICLPVARGGCHGLYIELKRQKGGRVTEEQTKWLEDLSRQGYAVAVCRGWERASEIIMEYLEQEGKA